MPPRTVLAAAYGVGEGLVKDLVHERTLARPRNTRYAGEHTERKLHVHALEVVLRRPEKRNGTRRLTALLGRLNAAPPGEEVARHGTPLGLDILDATGGDDLTAMHPGAGPDVDNVIGVAYGLLVVLDHDERVAEVAQLFERGQEPPVVPLVQTYGGFIQHVKHAHEAAPDL